MQSASRTSSSRDRLAGFARRLVAFLALATAAFFSVPAHADEPAVAEIPPDLYLGLFSMPVQPSLAAQLEEVLPRGKGLVVTDVLPGSPADRAGLKPHDILTEYAGKPLASVADLRRLVRQSDPEVAIPLSIVRRAKPESLRITPVVRPAPAASVVRYKVLGRAAGEKTEGAAARIVAGVVTVDQAERTAQLAAEASASATLALQTTDGKTWTATWTRLDEAGRKSPQTSSGTSDELRKKIEDWPAAARNDVRAALDEALLATDARPRSVRFRILPRGQGTARGVRLILETPGPNRELRVFQLDHAFAPGRPAKAEELLALDELKNELKTQTPAVRQSVEQTLKRLSIPEVRVNVQNAQ